MLLGHEDGAVHSIGASCDDVIVRVRNRHD